ncbi:MAG: cysteine desulfurase-like protein [Anaerolineae bacterium]|nr:cysteine desulfurase-like protein [Anaerolineae bacterium]
MSMLDTAQIRAQFPALQQQVNGQPAIFFDGPAGTQSPQSVIDAMRDYLATGSSNLGGEFVVSQRTGQVAAAARHAMADMLNARHPEEISFGQNMTSLTFAVSRAIARTWQAGDEIIVTRLDHDANIAPWLLAAEDKGVTVRWLDFDSADCTLQLDTLPDLLTDKTRLLAITLASNAVGSITDIRRAVDSAHANGTLVYVDSVHYAPHGLINVQAFDCDFLVCSAYKFYGPHTGILYGKYEHMAALTAYKVRPAPALPPGKWETGTQSFESLAGVTAAVDYLAGLSTVNGDRRTRLSQAMANINLHETALSERFLRGVTSIPGLKVYGITDIERLDERAPTFAISLEGYTAAELAQRLGTAGIFVWDGHYYAVAVMERLGLLESGGLVRIGFVHYNTSAEVDRLLDTLHALAAEITETN